jgi:hypothetical protein
VRQTTRFSIDRLGFEVDFRYEKDPENYAGVRRDDVRLHMHRQPSEHFENGGAGRLKFRIPVDDPDALFAEFPSSMTASRCRTPSGARGNSASGTRMVMASCSSGFSEGASQVTAHATRIRSSKALAAGIMMPQTKRPGRGGLAASRSSFLRLTLPAGCIRLASAMELFITF